MSTTCSVCGGETQIVQRLNGGSTVRECDRCGCTWLDRQRVEYVGDRDVHPHSLYVECMRRARVRA